MPTMSSSSAQHNTTKTEHKAALLKHKRNSGHYLVDEVSVLHAIQQKINQILALPL